MARDTFTTITAGSTSHASDQMAVVNAVARMERATPFSAYMTSTTMVADRTLTDADDPIQVLDCNGANRILNLPAVASTNGAFYIINKTAATYNVTVKNAGGTVLATVLPGYRCVCISDGTAWYCMESGARLIGQQVLTAGTVTYTPSPGAILGIVECWGAGGGGGGGVTGATATSVGSGGGNGGYARKLVIFTKASYTVSVPSGGAGGVAGNNNGTAGAACTFDSPSICTGAGGSAGLAGGTAGTTANVIPGGAQTSASGVGDLSTGGGGGQPSIRMSATQAVAGGGGAGYFGGGGYGKDVQGAGANATAYGAGGGGGNSLNGGASVAGGNGGPGLIVVTEFA